MTMYSLNTPIEKLTRVGKATARLLANLNIDNVLELLYYFPFRYEDFSQLVKIKDLRPNQTVTIAATIKQIHNRKSWHKKLYLTEALLEDETGSVNVLWFNQPFLVKNLHIGDQIFISGKTELSGLNLQFISPTYEKASNLHTVNTGKIVPVYPLTGRLTQKQLRFLIGLTLSSIELVADWLPEEIRIGNDLIPLQAALREIHFPADFADLAKAQRRLKFDELFLIQAQSQLAKKYLAQNKAAQIQFQEIAIKNFVTSLPYELTADQKKSAWQILLDLEKTQPMNRLLEGDVGSGKTIVAALAMLNTVLNDFQVVLMAPTEILASQHYQTICKFLEPFELKIGLLTGSATLLNNKPVSKKILLGKIKNNQLKIIIGTHALIQSGVSYANLGLAIIDEQHRFGVEQRKALKEKNLTETVPHFLSMTATPIPRSLALIIYGDLDLSIIKQMPKGRKKIITSLIAENQRHKAYQFIRQEIKSGRQVFVICPLIDSSDKLGVKSVTEEFKKLSKTVFPEFSIGLLHGKLKAKDKDAVMQDFKNNKINILVSTSVIEVGIDIPNATIMMIEGADRFGLAQLHQFRGRVGRGEYQSYCLLFTDNHSDKTWTRLSALVKSHDGFALAEYDLQFRGPGEVYGVKQSGLPNLQLATLTDSELITLSKKAATEFFSSQQLQDWPLLKEKLQQIQATSHLE